MGASAWGRGEHGRGEGWLGVSGAAVCCASAGLGHWPHELAWYSALLPGATRVAPQPCVKRMTVQGIIFSKRHDQHNMSIYAAYQEARKNRKQAIADARAEKRAAFKAERLQARNKAAVGRGRGGGVDGLGHADGGEDDDDWDVSSGSGSIANERDVLLTAGDGAQAAAGGAGGARTSVDANAGVVNFRRHRERESRPSHDAHAALEVAAAAAASAGVTGAGARAPRGQPSPDPQDEEDAAALTRASNRRRDAPAAVGRAELPVSPTSGRHGRQPAKLARPGSRARGATAAADDSSAGEGHGQAHDEAECQGGDADWGTSPLRRHTSGGAGGGRGRGGGGGGGAADAGSDEDDHDPAALHSRSRRRLLGGDGPGPLGEGREWRRSHGAASEEEQADAHLLGAGAAVRRGMDGSSGSGVALLPKAGGGRASRRANDHHTTTHSHAAQQAAGAMGSMERKRTGGPAPDVAGKAHAHSHAHRVPADPGMDGAAMKRSGSGSVWDHVPRQGSGRRLLGDSSVDGGSGTRRGLFGKVAQEAAAATAATGPFAVGKNAAAEAGNEEQGQVPYHKRPVKHASTYSGGSLGGQGTANGLGGTNGAHAGARSTRARSAPGRKATSGLSGGGAAQDRSTGKSGKQWGWMGANVSNSDSDGSGSGSSRRRSQEGGVMGVLTWPLRAAREVWCAVREANGFRCVRLLLDLQQPGGFLHTWRVAPSTCNALLVSLSRYNGIHTIDWH